MEMVDILVSKTNALDGRESSNLFTGTLLVYVLPPQHGLDNTVVAEFFFNGVDSVVNDRS